MRARAARTSSGTGTWRRPPWADLFNDASAGSRLSIRRRSSARIVCARCGSTRADVLAGGDCPVVEASGAAAQLQAISDHGPRRSGLCGAPLARLRASAYGRPHVASGGEYARADDARAAVDACAEPRNARSAVRSAQLDFAQRTAHSPAYSAPTSRCGRTRTPIAGERSIRDYGAPRSPLSADRRRAAAPRRCFHHRGNRRRQHVARVLPQRAHHFLADERGGIDRPCCRPLVVGKEIGHGGRATCRYQMKYAAARPPHREQHLAGWKNRTPADR